MWAELAYDLNAATSRWCVLAVVDIVLFFLLLHESLGIFDECTTLLVGVEALLLLLLHLLHLHLLHSIIFFIIFLLHLSCLHAALLWLQNIR